MRARLILSAAMLAAALGGCTTLAQQEGAATAHNDCRNAPDPGQCVRDHQSAVEAGERRQARWEREHRAIDRPDVEPASDSSTR